MIQLERKQCPSKKHENSSLHPCFPVSLHAKIKYQKNKTNQNSNEEDMHNRKSKMKRLQKELLEFPTNMSSKIKNAKKNAVTKID